MKKGRRSFCQLAVAVSAALGTMSWTSLLVEAVLGADEPTLRHTFRLNPFDALRHNQVGVNEEGAIDFSRRIREQYARSGRLDCMMEFVLSERKAHMWKFTIHGPILGFFGKCEKSIGKYVGVQVMHNRGAGYEPAGEFRIGVAIKDGRKRFVAYNVDKAECHEEEASEQGLMHIFGWIFAIAAGLMGFKILGGIIGALLGIIPTLLALVLFAILAKILLE